MLTGGTPRGLGRDGGKREGEQLALAEMHPFAQGIADFQHAHDPVGEGLDDGNFQPEAEIPDLRGKRPAFIQQILGLAGQPMQALQQRRRGLRQSQLLDRRASRCKRIARQVDAIEVFEILAASCR